MNSLSSISKYNKAFSAKYSRPKQKQKKMDKKSNEDSINAKSISSYYNVTPEQNIAYLTKNLKGDSYENELVNMFLKENQNINGLIEKKEMNEKDIIETIEKTSNFDGEIFEEKVAQIFANNFDIEALNLYPYFEIVNSKKKHKKVEDLDFLLTKVTIKVEKHEKELDGFFLSTKEILLENTIGDKLNIPKGKPIILEVKNNSNYQNIIDNIKEKKRIIRLLGLNDDLFFFVGILRDININEEEKNKINQTINNFNFKNTIIIYPENSKFLGISFIKEKANEYRGILSEIFNRLNQLDEIKKDIAELKSQIK